MKTQVVIMDADIMIEKQEIDCEKLAPLIKQYVIMK